MDDPGPFEHGRRCAHLKNTSEGDNPYTDTVGRMQWRAGFRHGLADKKRAEHNREARKVFLSTRFLE